MSEPVISITSSDEEDSKPAKKKRKLSPHIKPEVTLSPIASRTTSAIVSLDSDEETEEYSALPENCTNSDILELKENDTKSNDPRKAEPSSSANGGAVESGKNDDPITLSDDEGASAPSDALIGSLNSNGVSLIKKPKTTETVSLIDSDSETETDKIRKVHKSKIKKNNTDSPDNTDMENSRTNSPKKSEAVVVLDDSDDEQKENHCEMADVEPFHVKNNKTKASDLPDESANSEVEPKQASIEAKARFKKFLLLVEERIIDSSFEEILPKKMPVIQKYFKKSGTYVNQDEFGDVLKESIDEMKKATISNAANSAIMAFYKVFEHLKAKANDTVVIVEEDNLPMIKKCWKTMNKLQSKIKQLEEAEVDWDDEDDSAYVLLDRYEARYNKIYARYCSYLKQNPYVGRSRYEKITYTISSYAPINEALGKKYKNGRNFPIYDELEKFITKVAEKEKLKLSESEISIETQKCFKFMGQTIQDKRKKELRESMHALADRFNSKYVDDDAATKDISLENKLKKNEPISKKKLDDEFEKYSNLQAQWKDKNPSECSSNSVETDSDEEQTREEIDVRSPVDPSPCSSKQASRSLTPEKDKASGGADNPDEMNVEDKKTVEDIGDDKEADTLNGAKESMSAD